tara:strand:- start:3562 stop:4842 length:1281 start_codon:yes stop_codon:yes gene_type:complete
MKRIRIKASYIWALFIAIFVVGWMVSDDLFQQESEQIQTKKLNLDIGTTDIGKVEAITVNAVKVKNKKTPLIVRASGVIETMFEISIVARRQGIVKNLIAQEGNWIKAGDMILELENGTLESDLDAAQADRLAALAVYNDTKRRFGDNGEIAVQLRSAKADLELNKKNYEITQSLVEQGVKSELALSQKRSLLRASETRLFELKNLPKELELSNSYAKLKSIDSRILRLKEQLNFTKVFSPQDGWLENLNVEFGEFVTENRPLAKLLGLQTLKLTVPIAQTNIGKIKIADPVKISFVGLPETYGVVGKIAAIANKATRTFNVEIDLDNSDGLLRAGMTAEAEVIIGEVEAFKVSPAHLNVKDDGQLTVKTVNTQNRVIIVPVNLVRTAGNFAFISGLKEDSLLLTEGQAFLNSGELVKYSLLEDEN